MGQIVFSAKNFLKQSSTGNCPNYYPGIGNGILNVVTTGEWDVNYGKERLAFNFQHGGITTWVAAALDNDQEIILYSHIPRKWYGLVLKGRPEGNQFITYYRIMVSQDGFNWTSPKDVHVYRGVTAGTDQINNKFPIPIIARAVKLIPLGWINHIATKLEALVSDDLSVPQFQQQTILVPAYEHGIAYATLSSYWDPNHNVERLRLNFQGGPGAWCAGENNLSQFVQFSASAPKLWTQVQLRGRWDADHWVTSFTVAYTTDGNTWLFVDNARVFQGVSDRNTIATRRFYTPVRALSLRIIPVSWVNMICLRAEVFYQDDYTYGGFNSN